MSSITVLADITVLSQPVQKTLVFALWYSALLWIPVRGMATLIDRRRARAAQPVEQPGSDPGYRIGMEILPPM